MKKNLRASYKGYKNTADNPIGMKEYLLLTAEFNKFLIQKVLDGYEVTLPARLGTLSIEGRKVKPQFDAEGNIIGLAPDWVKTKKHWAKKYPGLSKLELSKIKNKPLMYHANEHTNGVRFKYVWKKNRVIAKNKMLYSVQLSRTNKRAVYQNIKNNKEYLIV